MRKFIIIFMLIYTNYAANLSVVDIRENIFKVDDKTLIDYAKRLSLKAIPSNQEELEAIIKNITPEYDVYPSTKERIELGKKLYFDPRLSRSGLISCNTCHNLALGGVDGVSISTGHKWQANPSHINTPTVLNAVFNSLQFWDGRANHLKEQAKGPIQANVEMAESSENVVKKIKSIPAYVEMFKNAYPELVDIDFDLIVATIAIFERTLITPSRFDKFLEGDELALSNDEKLGLRTFINKGCILCHNGINIGGSFRGFGFERYQYVNYGDFSGNENARVKVPSLRNVEYTAPYFHNGSVWSLTEAVESMGRIQLGIELSESEISALISFLKSLSGTLKDFSYPRLPPSSDYTIRPKLDL